MAAKSDAVVTKKAKRAAPKKKKEGPKRPISAFFIYMGERRVQLLVERPELKTNVKEIGKIVGEEWQKMSAETKQPYLDRAKENKERYLEQLAAGTTIAADAAPEGALENTPVAAAAAES